MRKYLICREDGQALHYIGGDLFWHKTNNFDSVVDSTTFDKKKEAKAFINRVYQEGKCPWVLHVVAIDLTLVP